MSTAVSEPDPVPAFESGTYLPDVFYGIPVNDNWGATAPYLAWRYSHVGFAVLKEAPSRHPHGHMVAECLARVIPDIPGFRATIYFYPYLTLQRQEPDGWMDQAAMLKSRGMRVPLENNSFGAELPKGPVRDLYTDKWTEPAQVDASRAKLNDRLIIFASGNSDKSRGGVPDWQADVNQPQDALARLPNTVVVGASTRDGCPSTFSSDGWAVTCSAWGERVPVFNPLTGRMEAVDGTSFASPYVAGIFTAVTMALDYWERTGMALHLPEPFIRRLWTKRAKGDWSWVRDYLLERGTVFEGWAKGQRHPKFGYVNLNKDLASWLEFNRTHSWSRNDVADLPLTYLDFDAQEGM